MPHLVIAHVSKIYCVCVCVRETLKSLSCHSVTTKLIFFPITERYFPIKAVLFTGGQDKLKSLSKSEWQQQDRWWLEGVWGCRLECIIMHRTAGSRDWEGCWAWVLSELSPQYRSVCPETTPLNHQEQSWKPWEETLHCPTESTHTFALQKCQTEIGIHHTHTQIHKRTHTRWRQSSPAGSH